MIEPLYTREEVEAIATSWCDTKLFDTAAELTRTFASRSFDLCSIINAKSGRCPEDCKWCAQSAHHHATCEQHGLVDTTACLTMAQHNQAQGIHRFSLVTSGRKPTPQELDQICEHVRALRRETQLSICVSLGLLDLAGMRQLAAAGVTRYHCNLEAAPSHFSTLCSTHTQADKIATLRAAREAGLSICSGGIIGMGESESQRIELAFTLRELAVDSIPINILTPIAGTPLSEQPLLSDREIMRTVALFRLVHPHTALRLAGGRARLSMAVLERLFELGINSAIEGDMLTTPGKTVADDLALIRQAGYTIEKHHD